MKKIRKAAMVGLFAAASFGLAACGSEDAQQKEGPVTINYYGRPDDNGVETAIVAAFEKANSDIKVNYADQSICI